MLRLVYFSVYVQLPYFLLFIVHIYTKTKCFGLICHLQMFKLVSHCRSLQGNCYCHCVFGFVLSSHERVRFSRVLAVEFTVIRCEVVMDVFMLLNSIQIAWRSVT
jgi:hypothetical protein